MTPAQRRNFQRLLSPRHIAFIGGRDAEVALREATRIGYRGEIWPVNPRREMLGGYRCHASVAELPEAPDATFLAVPAEGAVRVTAELAARGAGGIACYAAGFRESGGQEGARLEAALVQAAGDMALIGPNCYGFINYIERVALWPFAHGDCRAESGAAIVTQSGMLSSDITHSQRSLPLAYMISCGNQAALSLEDYTDFLIDLPEVRVIGLHIEGLIDVPRFAEVALRALRCGKPIVALKTGSSQIGARLTVSHTGSLSGDEALHDALFDRCGVTRVHSPATLLETLKLMVFAGVPSANRIAAFTCSGGGATMLADHAEHVGLALPPVPPEGEATLARLLPSVATVSNPLDYTTPIWGNPERTRPVFAAGLDATAAAAAVLVQDYPAPGLDESRPLYLADAMALLDAARAREVPAAIIATLPENIDARTRAEIIAAGGAPLQGLSEGLDALAAAVRWGAARARIMASPPDALVRARPVTGALQSLDEARSKTLLSDWGLPVPDARLCSGAEILRESRAYPYPVALKMMSPLLAHKSEAGAVATGIADRRALLAALEAMRAKVQAHCPEAVTDSFLVESMAPRPVVELVVGLRRDPRFGTALTLGAGGVLVELLRDTAALLLPTSPDAVRRALSGLRVAPLLAGYRGAPAADTSALVALLSKLAEGMMQDETIAEIEINPLFVGSEGCLIVDALVHRQGA
ncbi:MAG: acetate--CoA ligase family protein [Rhodobacteraceae bacterium]|nr:acetate--CoA ligase family protein [Paracoccaceae bacterium]